MKNKNRQLSMKERWDIDRKSGATFLVSSPQCEICANVIKNDAVKCLAYKEIKPNDVRRCKKECPKFKIAFWRHLTPLETPALTE